MDSAEQLIIDRAQKEIAQLRAERQAADSIGKAECCNEQPKPWVEASIEEKIERIRQMVKSLQHSANYQDERVRKALNLRDDLIEHRHADDNGGKVMLPADVSRKRVDDYGGGCCTAAQEVSPEKAYF